MVDHLTICSVCSCVHQKQVPATHIATDELGFQWFECDEHGPNDSEIYIRVSKMPIGEWRNSYCIW